MCPLVIHRKGQGRQRSFLGTGRQDRLEDLDRSPGSTTTPQKRDSVPFLARRGIQPVPGADPQRLGSSRRLTTAPRRNTGRPLSEEIVFSILDGTLKPSPQGSIVLS